MDTITRAILRENAVRADDVAWDIKQRPEYSQDPGLLGAVAVLEQVRDSLNTVAEEPTTATHERKTAMSERETEAEIQAKGLNAPRLTPELIDAAILSEHYISPGRVLLHHGNFTGRTHDALDSLTICILVLRNGYTIVGKSAPASPENFDAELGRKIAREDARRQIWALEGYALKSKLAEAQS